MLWTGTKVALERTAHIPPLAGRIPMSAVIYVAAAIVAAVPYLVSILGPESVINTLVSLLSSLDTL